MTPEEINEAMLSNSLSEIYSKMQNSSQIKNWIIFYMAIAIILSLWMTGQLYRDYTHWKGKCEYMEKAYKDQQQTMLNIENSYK